MSKLVLEQISVASPEGEIRVDSANLIIKKGDLVYILGANGSGKSSLLKGLMGFAGYKTTGNFDVDGCSMAELSTTEKTKKGLFFSPQQTPSIEGVKLISLIHGAYLNIYGDDSKINILDLRKQGIELAQKYGLKTELLDRPIGVGFSGGEKKQSELLQLLLLRPDICLLDEIDSGLDIDSVATVKKIVEDLLGSGSTVIMVSHNINLLEALDPQKIYLMNEGKIVEEGGVELLSKIKENGF